MTPSLRRSVAAAGLVFVATPCLVAQNQPQAPQVSVTGLVYTQYLYQLKDSLGAGHQNQFAVQRAYVNVIGRLSGGVQTRLTVDIAPTGAPAQNQVVRLKYAYAAWTPARSSLTYKLGLIHTPLVDWEEALWDYRMQGPIALDRNGPAAGVGYLTAADFGAGIDGSWNREQVNGQLTVVNGEGYSGGTGDNRKDVQARVSVRVKPTNDASRVGGVRVTGYAGIGKANGGADRNRFLGMLSYKTQQITLAGEFASTKDAAITGSVISVFGVYHLTGSKVALIARVDLFDPNTDTPDNRQTRVIGGASYQLSPNVRVLADVDLLSYEGGSTPLQDATRSRALFQAQFTF